MFEAISFVRVKSFFVICNFSSGVKDVVVVIEDIVDKKNVDVEFYKEGKALFVYNQEHSLHQRGR